MKIFKQQEALYIRKEFKTLQELDKNYQEQKAGFLPRSTEMDPRSNIPGKEIHIVF